MKRTMFLSFMATILYSLLVFSVHASDISSSLNKVNQQFETAFSKGDAAGLAAVYTKKGQIMPPNSDIITGVDKIKSFWQGAIDSGVKAANLETVELDHIGDTAIEVGRYVLKNKAGSMIDKGKYIVVWKKENGSWKWDKDIWSSQLSK